MRDTALEHELSAPPADGDGFRTERPLRAGDVDTDNRLRYDSVARYLQDIGSDNLDASGLDGTDPLWIVRRTVIDVRRPAVWPDRIALHRWCSGLSTRWSNMRVDISSPKGALIETEAFWINISPTTGMPTRISDEGIGFLQRTTDEHRLKWKAWLTEPLPAPSSTDFEFPLRVTDIDAFNHVNNAAYWQAVEEVVADADDITSVPHRAVIEYMSPILAREHVIIRQRREGSTITIWFVVDEKVRTVARFSPLVSG
jgi:acyl-ACP thioesterase